MSEYKKSGGFGGKRDKRPFNNNRGRPAGGHGGGGSRFGQKPRFGHEGSQDRGQQRMYDAICSNCGKHSEVPFRPTGDKPVFCKECFAKMRGGDDSRPAAPKTYVAFDSNRRDSDSGSHGSSGREDRRITELQQEVRSLHNKLDTLLELVKKNTPKEESADQNVQAIIDALPAKKPTVRTKKVTKSKKKEKGEE